MLLLLSEEPENVFQRSFNLSQLVRGNSSNRPPNATSVDRRCLIGEDEGLSSSYRDLWPEHSRLSRDRSRCNKERRKPRDVV